MSDKTLVILMLVVLSGCGVNQPVDLQPYIQDRFEYPASHLFYPKLINNMGCPLENMQAYAYPDTGIEGVSPYTGYGQALTVKCDNRDPREYSCVFNVEGIGFLVCLNDQGVPEDYAQIVRNNSR